MLITAKYKYSKSAIKQKRNKGKRTLRLSLQTFFSLRYYLFLWTPLSLSVSLSPPLPTRPSHSLARHLITLSSMAAPPPQKPVSLLLIATVITILVDILGDRNIFVAVEGASWCVTRSDASAQALQTALDYACGAGADCSPIQSNGLCYLPNTIQAHASYAFNSYYQRKAMAPGSCDFSGTATIAQTDPSLSPFYEDVLFLF